MVIQLRIDDRLIHGEVITMWLRYTNAEVVMVVDDETATNQIMKKILICTKVVEERVAVLIPGYNDRVLERGQIRKSPGVD